MFRIENWAGATPADVTLNTNAVRLIVVLMPAVVAPVPGEGQCVANAANGLSAEAVALNLPAGVLGPRLASAEMIRVAAYPSVSPTPSSR